MGRRITYLLSRYPAVSHTFFLNEIRALRQQGFDLDVISINDCDRPTERLARAEREERNATFYLKSSGLRTILGAQLKLLTGSPRRYLGALKYAIRLSRGAPHALLYRIFYLLEAAVVIDRMRQTGSDHLHVHFGSEVATVGLLAKRLAPIRLSLTIHGSDEFYDVSEYHLGEKMAAADFVFCISRYTASQLMRLCDYAHWGKISIAPLGVDTDKFRPGPRRTPGDPVNILCVGRLNAAKGLHVLITAIARLAPRFPEVSLTLVGDGEERASLETLIDSLGLQQRVRFAGVVNQDHILPWYRQADIFCLPSFAEGVPVVLMEAMATGLPCVTSRITGIPELIDDGEDGLLVTAADAEALADALAQLIASPQLRHRLGIAARRKVVAKYNLARNFQALGQAFRRQLARLDSVSTDPAANADLPQAGAEPALPPSAFHLIPTSSASFRQPTKTRAETRKDPARQPATRQHDKATRTPETIGAEIHG